MVSREDAKRERKGKPAAAWIGRFAGFVLLRYCVRNRFRSAWRYCPSNANNPKYVPTNPPATFVLRIVPSAAARSAFHLPGRSA